MGIKVGQLNLHHSRDASALLQRKLLAGDLDIALVQEPWTRNGYILGLKAKGYNIFYDKSCARPRACIIVNSRLNAINLINFLDGDIVAIKLCHKNSSIGDLVFVSAYLPFEDKDPLSSYAKAIISYCGNDKKLIFGCDANAHHTVWGSSDCNRRGYDLLEYVSFYDLHILNRGNIPTFVVKNRSEVIDITLCNLCCANYIQDWKVSGEVTASDHQLIIFTVSGLDNIKVEGRNPRLTDWSSYNKDLQALLEGFNGNYNTCADIELAVDQVQQAILDAYQRNCRPMCASSPRRVPWWSVELSILRRKCRKLFNRAKKTKVWQPYRDALTIYSKAIRSAKRNSWQNFCEGIKDIPATSRVARILSKDNSCKLNAIKLPNGNFSETGDETLAEMLRVHFPGSCDALDSEAPNTSAFSCDKSNWDAANLVVSLDKVTWAIKSFKPYKSPGLDGIVPVLLQKGVDHLAPVLCRIFRSCIAYGYIPKSWCYTKVVFLPKVGKDNYFEAKSFRPISLTSFLLKTLEKLVDRYLRDQVLADCPLSTRQHAYQPGRSTDTALYDISFLIEKSMAAKEIALAVFLDIEGAFDRVPVDTIIRSLDRFGTNPHVSRWIRNLLISRFIVATLLDSTRTVRAVAGCPQGGVLSPVLWCCVVDSLLSCLTGRGISCLGYADDVAIVVRGRFGRIVSDILNDVLRLVDQWCKREGLSVNPSKTSLVAFTKRRALDLNDVFFSGVKLVCSTEVKFLGVTFDHHLNWGKHLELCVKKANKVFWCCRGSIGKTWGLSPKAISWIYSMIICPIITYGSIAWWSRVRVESARAELNRLQRVACVAITGCLRTTPTAALELLLGLPSLHLRIEAEVLICMGRLKRSNIWKEYSRYLSWGLLDSTVVQAPFFTMPSDGILVRYAFRKPFKVIFPSRDEWQRNPSWLTSDSWVWYTDGSLMNHHVGAGIFCPKDGTCLSFPLGKYASVFQAEVFAIYKCICLCLARGNVGCCIYICSDSQAALLSLWKCGINSALVWDCYSALCNLADCNRVTLCWVPGHVGVQGNECADRLARLGSSSSFVGPEPVLGIAPGTIRKKVFNYITAKQHLDWRNASGQRQAKELNQDPSLRHHDLLKLNRRGLRRVIGLLTGHCILKRHLKVMGICNDAICRGCGAAEETSRHILCDCDFYSALRFEHLGQHFVDLWCLQDIPVRCLLNFASATGLFA